MKAQVRYLEQPLTSMQLQGIHLIEASAGTGKTWTLASLMVRILAEKYLPRQVIATTFTRAAAAELKTRIRLRLMEIDHYARQWQQLAPSDYAEHYAALKDPLAQLMFSVFSKDQQGLANFGYLENRLKLVLASLDELFVGTIDSFTQKLLREFGFESGEIRARQISDHESQYAYQIVHDALRAWLQQQTQANIDLLLASKALKNVEHYILNIKSGLNFNQAKLLPVAEPYIQSQALYDCIAALKHCDRAQFAALKPLYLSNAELKKCFDARTWGKGKLDQLISIDLPELLEHLSHTHLSILFVGRFKTVLQKLGHLQQAKGIKNSDDPSVTALLTAPLLSGFFALSDCVGQLSLTLEQLEDYLRYYLTLQVRQQLPQLLVQAEETTFNQQTQTLAADLYGDQGQRMAEAILQRYPVILVDEFQDTSQEQDQMLQAVWRQPERLQQGCFVAVGDPKQAIYGFRGGDILTYLNAFNDIAAKGGVFYQLQHNFRSTPALVSAVDALFLRNCDFAEDIDYRPAQAGNNAAALLYEQHQPDTQPLRWLKLDAASNEAFIIAHKIQHLLALSEQQQLYIAQQGDRQAITADDIAVLAYSNYELDQLQAQLETLGIAVNRVALRSVFSSSIATEIAAILQAMIQPDHESVLRRALLSPLIGLQLSDFVAYSQQADGFSQHMRQFRQARQLCSKSGFLMAWQVLAEHYQFWAKLAEHRAQLAERDLVNARHILELLSQQSQQHQGLQHLQQWYQLQLSAPAQREWEMERKLSSASGIQLMTIHKSKGLEFKIVFLMAANKEIKPKTDSLIFFSEQKAGQSSRVIAISESQVKDNQAALASHQDKLCAENHRLWYVALTRASYRMYVSLLHQKSPAKIPGGVDYWLQANPDIEFSHPALVTESLALDVDTALCLDKPELDLVVTALPQQSFYPKTRTSFSYMAAHLKPQALDVFAELADQNQAAEDENHVLLAQPAQVDDVPMTDAAELSWLARNFPRGTQAGNCLHNLLENLDFQDQKNWDRDINRQLYQAGLWDKLLASYQRDYPEVEDQHAIKQQLVVWIKEWLSNILATPLLPEQSICLKDLAATQRLPEFGFFLALAEQRFDTAKLHQVFVARGIVMPEFSPALSARYLNGAIDLLYFDGQRYHIADYKSNALGTNLLDYLPHRLAENMTTSSYWLQAGLYLVALHRYLQQALLDYQPEQHLGGASYLYLRGMTAEAGYGVYYWPADLALILELDRLLGDISPPHSVDNYV